MSHLIKTDFVRSVREFHRAMGHEAPSDLLIEISDKTAALRKVLIREEALEVKRALHADRRGPNIVELADGLADTIYVLAGTLVVYGDHKQKSHVESGKGSKFDRLGDPFVTIDWVFGFQLSKVLNALDLHTTVSERSIIISEVDNMMAMCVDIANFYKIPILEIFEEVHRSNMAKFWSDGKPRYYESSEKQGKIKKPPGWKPPAIEEMLKKCQKKSK